MKRIFLLLVGLCVSGCFNGEKHATDWQPIPYREPVDCCMSAEQVQGAIRTAMIKRDWHVLDIEDNRVYAYLSCYGTEADVVFSSTDKYYDITFENVKEADFNDHDCIYSKIDDLNYVINRYLRKISKRNAKAEMKAAKKAMKQ